MFIIRYFWPLKITFFKEMREQKNVNQVKYQNFSANL
jgi:hypothetical protein